MIGLIHSGEENRCLQILVQSNVDVGDKVEQIFENFLIAG